MSVSSTRSVIAAFSSSVAQTSIGLPRRRAEAFSLVPPFVGAPVVAFFCLDVSAAVHLAEQRIFIPLSASKISPNNRCETGSEP